MNELLRTRHLHARLDLPWRPVMLFDTRKGPLRNDPEYEGAFASLDLALDYLQVKGGL